MNRFILSPAAFQDIQEIWGYFAHELQNLEVADRIRDELFQAMKKLGEKPGLGHFRSDLSSEPLRFWLVRNFLVIYRSELQPIQIVRILHGSRDIQTLLESD